MKQQMGMGLVKVGAALAIILMFVIIHLIAPNFLPSFISLLASGDITATVEYIRSFGDGAVLFAFFLTLFTNALGFPPAIIFSTANVILFGLFQAFCFPASQRQLALRLPLYSCVFISATQLKRSSQRVHFSQRSIITAAAKAFLLCSSAVWFPISPLHC